MAWAVACWCLKIITQHHTEETLSHFYPNLPPCNTHSQFLIFFSGDISPLISKTGLQQPEVVSLMLQKSLSPKALLEPDWGSSLHIRVMESHINHPASQVITHPPRLLTLRNQRALAWESTSSWPQRVQAKWKVTWYSQTCDCMRWAADFEGFSLLPPLEGWLHIIFYLHIYGFLLEMICVSLSLFSKGIKKRNSNCWTQWSESSQNLVKRIKGLRAKKILILISGWHLLAGWAWVNYFCRCLSFFSSICKRWHLDCFFGGELQWDSSSA